MRKKRVVNITATLADVSYAMSGYNTPFVRGQECVLCIAKSSDYDAGALHIETDNSESGGTAVWTDVHTSAVSDAGTAGQADFMTYNITLGDNIRVGTGTYVAGSCEIFLLGDS